METGIGTHKNCLSPSKIRLSVFEVSSGQEGSISKSLGLMFCAGHLMGLPPPPPFIYDPWGDLGPRKGGHIRIRHHEGQWFGIFLYHVLVPGILVLQHTIKTPKMGIATTLVQQPTTAGSPADANIRCVLGRHTMKQESEVCGIWPFDDGRENFPADLVSPMHFAEKCIPSLSCLSRLYENMSLCGIWPFADPRGNFSDHCGFLMHWCLVFFGQC